MKSFTFILFSLLLVDGCLLAFAEGRQRRPEGDAPGLPIAVQPAERKASKPQSVPSKASKVLTLEEFKDEKFKAPTEKTTVSVQIHPSLSNYVLRLIPAPVDDPDRGRQPVGRIEIFKHPSGPVFQAINVSAEASTDFFKRCTEFVDINHDGYLDLKTLAEFGGAKWGRYQYWVFDPKSGRFISNWLTKRLSRFQCNGIRPNARTGEIHVRYLVFDGVMNEGYQIQGRRLILVSQVKIKPKMDEASIETKGWILTTMRMTNGKMRAVKVEELPELTLQKYDSIGQ